MNSKPTADTDTMHPAAPDATTNQSRLVEAATSDLVPAISPLFAPSTLSENAMGLTCPKGAVVTWNHVWGYRQDDGQMTNPYRLRLTLDRAMPVTEVLPYMWSLYLEALGPNTRPRGVYSLEDVRPTSESIELIFGP